MAQGKILTSIHGRRLGLSSSGGLVMQPTTSTASVMAAEVTTAGVFNSTISSFSATLVDMTVQKFQSVVETISTSGADLAAWGVSVLSSATSTARNFTIGAPAAGMQKIIHSLSSATTVTLETTADTLGFSSSANASSTKLTFSAAAGVQGRSIVMAGLDSGRWLVVSNSADIS